MQSACFVRRSARLHHLSKFVRSQNYVSVSHHHVQHQTRISQRNFSALPQLFCSKHISQTQTCSHVPRSSDFGTAVRTFSSEDRSSVQDVGKEEEELPEFKAFYRLPSIITLRIISRVKIAQTALTLGILPPLYHYHAADMVTTLQLQFSIGLATFALFMLYTMSFYLRRVIGAMYVHRDGHVVKVSHLTFWGSRRDSLVPTADVIPLSEGSNKAGEVLLRLERYSTKDVLYFTLRFGLLTDLEKFEEVFGNLREIESQGQSKSSSEVDKK